MTNKLVTKEKATALLALLSFTAYMPVSLAPAFGAIASNTLPDLKSSINGSVSTSGNLMNVNNDTYAAGTVAQFDWNTFNVGKDARVNFGFSANSQTILNRVMASGGMSEIYGQLTNSTLTGCASCRDTSKVILINPSGILFGQGSKVNLNSFTASTFDVKGAKDLSSMSSYELSQYKGYNETTKTVGGGLFDIAGYNKNVSFVGNNNMVSTDGNGVIKVNANGTRLASIVADGAEYIYGEKNVAFGGNKIEINNGTRVSTRYDSTPNTATKYDANGNATWNDNRTKAESFQTRSSIRMITGDGVNFYYTSNGNTQNMYNGMRDGSTTSSQYLPFAYTRSASNMVSGQDYGVKIKDSTVTAGTLDIHNGVENTNHSSVDIENSIVHSRRLLGADSYTSSGSNSSTRYYAEEQGTQGALWITGKGDINIKNSDIQVTNDTTPVTTEKGGTSHTITGADIKGGYLVLETNDDINVTNTYLRTMDSTKNTDSLTSGTIYIKSLNSDINLTKTSDAPNLRLDGEKLYIQVQAAGGLDLNANNGDININGYDKIWSLGDTEISGTENRYIRAITANADNINLSNTILNSGTINLNADEAINTSASTVQAVNDLNMYAKNTNLDQNSAIAYSNISLIDPNSNKVNNVTVKNGTTFKNPTGVTTIKTNGDIVVDNSNLQGRYCNESATNQKAINLESTQGDITIKNASYMTTTDGSITVTTDAANKNITVTDSKLYSNNGNEDFTATNNIAISNSHVWAKTGDVNLTAINGKVTATNNSQVAGEFGNTTIRQAQPINIPTDYANSVVSATNKLTLKSDSDITGQKLTAGTGYINSNSNLVSLMDTDHGATFVFTNMEMNSDNNITATNAMSMKNVDLVATGYIDLDSTGNMTLTNVSTKSGTTTDLTAVGRLQTDGYEIKDATKATLNGNTISTKDYSTINVNQNKLALNADYDINVRVQNANNAAKGIEVNANVNTSNGSNALAGKNVTVNATDGTLAISKIKADTLNLTANTILASATTISSSNDNIAKLNENNVSTNAKAYIEIKTDGGFNLDPTTVYNDGNSNIYTGGDYGSTTTNKVNVGSQYSTYDTQVISEVENSTLIATDTTKGDEAGRENVSKTLVSSETSEPVITNGFDEYGNPGHYQTTTTTNIYQVTDDVTYNTTQTDTYRDTKTTTTETTTNVYQDYQITTTGNDTHHIATLNNNEKNAFVLVYGKNDSSTRTGTDLVSTNTQTNTNTEVINEARHVNTPGTVIEQDVYNVTEVTSESIFCGDQDSSGNNPEILNGGNKKGTSSGGSQELEINNGSSRSASNLYTVSSAPSTNTKSSALKSAPKSTALLNTAPQTTSVSSTEQEKSTTTSRGRNNSKMKIDVQLDEEPEYDYFSYLGY